MNFIDNILYLQYVHNAALFLIDSLLSQAKKVLKMGHMYVRPNTTLLRRYLCAELTCTLGDY